MKRNKTYMRGKQLLNELNIHKQSELTRLMATCCDNSYTAQEVKQLITEHIGIKLTTQCANEVQQHYRKLYKDKKLYV